MKKFLISEEEKNRILGMHQDATKRHYLSEQGYTQSKSQQDIDKERIYNENIAKINKMFPVNLQDVNRILVDISKPGLTEQQYFDIAQPWIEKNGVTIQFMTGSPTIENEGKNYTSKFKTQNMSATNNYKAAVKYVLEDAKDLYLGLVGKAQQAKGLAVNYPPYFKTKIGQDVLNSFVKKAGLQA